jgi:peptidoglycan hydrolase CwlO-like protein
MFTRILFFFTLGITVAYSQPLNINDQLVLPVNPPKGPWAQTNTSISIDTTAFETQLNQVAQTQAELKAALANGLAEGHPQIKSLRAKLAVLQSQIVVPPKAAAPESTEISNLRKEIEALKKASKQDQELLLKEMAGMKTTIEQLRDALATLKNK